jgi:hypothetical protein|uniref:Uncharacterized protein n=1 Tax=virus sp. ctEfN2 TaxID=2825810 RepID=A0A8S5RM96_9VIRU|nr:MAG TPA: hypothetical protein [virus sp. ctEfN2]DAX01263.1 MAG TPA: hypothetical protein [Bacteriophage sp.]
MGTISRESAKRRNKETSRQKRRRSKISDITRRKNTTGKDELNVMK